MESSTTPVQHRWASHTLSRKLPLYLRMALVLVIGLSASTCGVVVLVRSTTQPTDPFASFIDVFPRKPRSAIEARVFRCPPTDEDADEYYTGYTCFLWPAAGPFAQVAAVISEGNIRQTVFTSRPNTLRVGDLMVLWGRPEIRMYSHAVYLLWRSHRIFAWVSDYAGHGQMSPFLPVWKVFFTDFLL